ncbi:DNA-binding transcriptional regulator, LysR family [Paenibacillus sp. UNC496MF]|uniref:LysR family transcriptional regulator n=1 Tax=Paenibacillus sp. UNC496MF TaxID=1502753 RepID=UPI0008DFB7EC|nr:LysR family transcriptional regulator [Paenibacillus sp. UNC496MF]SFJ70649.1 DNA-binding transcriptional regulator, LysR family [Paenibacillus sp. UNC496MF]
MRMEWLEAFRQTAETKSLTKASESLHISQPALSKQIRNLETELGAQLLTRSSVGVSLTPAGQILLERSKVIANEMNAMKREIALMQDEGKVDLTIGSWPSVATIFLPARIAGNRQATTKLEIKIRVFYCFHDFLTHLDNGILDAAFFDDRGVKHAYHSTPAFTEPFFLFVNNNHPLYGSRDEVSFDEIKQETFVMLPDGCDVRMLVEEAFAARGEQLNVALEIELGQSILGFIHANLGISILPAIFINQMKPTMKAIPIQDFESHRQISVITRDESVSKRLLGFIFNP